MEIINLLEVCSEGHATVKKIIKPIRHNGVKRRESAVHRYDRKESIGVFVSLDHTHYEAERGS